MERIKGFGMNETDIRLLEETTANMLPPQKSMLYDGWLLRFSPGKSRNPNSVWPIYDGRESLESKIRFCEQQYQTRGLTCSFRLSELLLAQGQQAGANTTFLSVSESNIGARRLYKRQGFTERYRYRYLVSTGRR